MFRTTVGVVLATLVVTGCGTEGTAPSTAPSAQTEVVIVEGPAELEDLIDWAFERFELAKLDRPDVARITFDPNEPSCPGRAAWTEPEPTGAEITICVPTDRLCVAGEDPLVFTTRARLCVLHELSHAWLVGNVEPPTEQAFLAFHQLDEWYDDGLFWRRRGVEVAAETLAWGLMDVRLSLYRLDHPSCDALQEGFELLTAGKPSLVDCTDPQHVGG